MTGFTTIEGALVASSIECLGYIIEDEGLRSNSRIVQVLMDFPILRLSRNLSRLLAWQTTIGSL